MANSIIAAALDDFERKIERGLTKWPDFSTAMCPINGVVYETYALGYYPGLGRTDDAAVIAAMLAAIMKIREDRAAKYISWRRHFDWSNETFDPESVIVYDGRTRGCNSGLPILGLERRKLTGRFMISAVDEHPGWLEPQIAPKHGLSIDD